MSFSFIGWALLCAAPLLIALGILIGIAVRTMSFLPILWIIPLSIPLSIGSLFLTPYQEAAYAAFYRNISGTRVVPDPALPESSASNFDM